MTAVMPRAAYGSILLLDLPASTLWDSLTAAMATVTTILLCLKDFEVGCCFFHVKMALIYEKGE